MALMGTTTTSRTGERAAAFTLLEIILALAIVGLIATALIGGSARMLASKPLTPDDVFWSAVTKARKTALEQGSAVQMAFDAKGKGFVITDASGGATTVAIPNPPQDLTVDLLPGDVPPTGGAIVAGTLIETLTIPSVTFYPDGTCTPFRLQIHNPMGAHILKLDPWTCAKILTPLNADGTPVLTPN
jgi:prepilin-type N-terminal cleavage/methylation domain-containing protein